MRLLRIIIIIISILLIIIESTTGSNTTLSTFAAATVSEEIRTRKQINYDRKKMNNTTTTINDSYNEIVLNSTIVDCSMRYIAFLYATDVIFVAKSQSQNQSQSQLYQNPNRYSNLQEQYQNIYDALEIHTRCYSQTNSSSNTIINIDVTKNNIRQHILDYIRNDDPNSKSISNEKITTTRTTTTTTTTTTTNKDNNHLFFNQYNNNNNNIEYQRQRQLQLLQIVENNSNNDNNEHMSNTGTSSSKNNNNHNTNNNNNNNNNTNDTSKTMTLSILQQTCLLNSSHICIHVVTTNNERILLLQQTLVIEYNNLLLILDDNTIQQDVDKEVTNLKKKERKLLLLNYSISDNNFVTTTAKDAFSIVQSIMLATNSIPTSHYRNLYNKTKNATTMSSTTILFHSGIHTITQPIIIDSTTMSRLSILGYNHNHNTTTTSTTTGSTTNHNFSWLSGSIPIPNTNNSSFWKPWKHIQHNNNTSTSSNANGTILVANLTLLLQQYNITVLPNLVSLFNSVSGNIYVNANSTNGSANTFSSSSSSSSSSTSSGKRYIRARYPNMDPEIHQWGYNSPKNLVYSIGLNEVLEWLVPEPNISNIPTFTYYDFRYGYPYNNTFTIYKNNSVMDMYNVYSTGIGGVCGTIWGMNTESYWCSNSSDGGWAEVDREATVTGQIQIPIGLSYNSTSLLGQHFSKLIHTKDSIIHAWHSQSWSMHMFQITFHNTSAGIFHFDNTGGGNGRQGGRNWCRCDQCTYAGNPYCKQYNTPIPDNTDTRLISGTWLIENILDELDTQGEYFFDKYTNLLYLYPNSTGDDKFDNNNDNIRLSVTESIFVLHNVSNVTISNIGIRETSSTYIDTNWYPPSGGDWSLQYNGVLSIHDSNNITISNCKFTRIDGNAIFIANRTRSITIQHNQFEWLGANAIVLWGNTNHFDGTDENFPLDTIIEYNTIRELGIYQKQSSGVSINKAAKTTIRYNIMYNIARAAINFNDMVGGGDIVEYNLLFNTCRESGDHGPINSWDRQPYLTKLLDGNTPSFVPLCRTIHNNFIFANYGAAQGVDNDDGSSYYNITNNVWYYSIGMKMDYGGHDSIYDNNLIIMYPITKRNQVCIDFQKFYKGHGHVAHNNTCIASNTNHNNNPIIVLQVCNDGPVTQLYNNTYYTPDGEATIQCGYGSDDTDDSNLNTDDDDNDNDNDDSIAKLYSLKEIQVKFGIELNSTVSKTPTLSKVLQMTLDKLMIPF